MVSMVLSSRCCCEDWTHECTEALSIWPSASRAQYRAVVGMTTSWCGGNTHELTLVFIKVFITFGTNWSFILNQILCFFPLFILRLKLAPLAYNLWTILLSLLCSSFSSELVLVAKIWSLSLVITNFFLTWKKMLMQCAIVPQSFNDSLFINYKRIFF